MAKRLCYTARLAEARWGNLRRRFYGGGFARVLRREPVIPQIAEPEIVAAATWLASVSRDGRLGPPGWAAAHYRAAMLRTAETANREARENPSENPEGRMIGFADASADDPLGQVMVKVRPGRCYGYLPNASVAAFVWPAEAGREYRERHGWPK